MHACVCVCVGGGGGGEVLQAQNEGGCMHEV